MSLPRKLINNKFLTVLLWYFLTLFAYPAWTADWKTSTQLTTQGTYTDNLQLTNTSITAINNKKESDFFIDVAPGVVVTGKGRHLNLDFAYSPQYIHYLSASSDDQINHRLQANAKSELYQDHLFFDVTASAQQELIDSLGPSGGDTANPTGNLQTTYTYQISPNYKNRFGRFVNLSLRFANNGVFYADTGGNSTGYQSQIEVSNGSALTSLRWGINAANERVESEGNGINNNESNQKSTTAFKNLTGSLGYQFNARWQMMTLFGYEENDYAAATETNGERWEFSGNWTPTTRTTIRLGAGHRYFGWSPVLEFNHRLKHSAWIVSFSRDISSARNERLKNEVYTFKDAFGETVIPETGDRVAVRPGMAMPTSATFVSSQFQTGYTLQLRRNTLGTALRYTLREYEGMSQDEENASASLFWTRKLTGLTTSHLALSWDQNQRKDTVKLAPATKATKTALANKTTNFTLDAGLSRQLSAHTNLDFQYRFLDSDEYTENRVTLGLRMTWAD